MRQDKTHCGQWEPRLPILMDVTRCPHALRITPMLLAVTPLPKPLTTPPLTSTYFIIYGVMLSWEDILFHNVLGFSYQQHNHRSISCNKLNYLISINDLLYR